MRRMELDTKLLRRHQEEQIIELVPLDDAWLEEKRSSFLNGLSQDDFLQQKAWTSADLTSSFASP